MEQTLVLIKPDAVQRRLAGEIIARIERKGLQLVGLKMIMMDEELILEHYAHLKDEGFFGDLSLAMRRAPVIAMCWQGLDCVETVRRLLGVTNSRKADPGTIRGDLSMSVQVNLAHASDSVETASVEVPRFFDDREIFTYPDALLEFRYSPMERAAAK